MNKPFAVHRLMPNDIVTEDSAAKQFVELHGDKIRYCHSHGKWFHWNGFYWKINDTSLAFHFARELARQLAENEDYRRRYKIEATSFAGGVERFAKADPELLVTMKYWNSDPWLLGTPGGTIDLRTGELRHSSQDEGITKITAVSPNADGCPLWLKLNQATGNDVELIRFLQQFCGYCLTGITREHALVFVYGPGGNGKSVFLNTVTTILKDYSVTSAMETFTASTSDRHPTDLAMLAGSRLVTASETEEGRAWAEARIKSFDRRRSDHRPLHAPRLLHLRAHVQANRDRESQARLHNVDDAAKRRFNIVPFILKPAAPDRQLEQKLMQKAPGILQWMIEGCLDWQQNGLIRPNCVIEATAEYFGDQDLFRHWMEEECICEPTNMDRSAPSSSLFKSWSDYAKAAGHKPGTTSTFKDNLTAAGFKFYRGAKVREFFGISLRP